MADTFKARFYSGIGSQGPQGPKGDKGDTGETGARGPAGPHYTPNVSTNGDLSWTNDGGLANPDTVNLTDKFVNTVEAARSSVDALDADVASLRANADDLAAVVSQAQAAVDGIEAQRDEILQSIADAAELGTDTTLTTQGMAADAKATGDAIEVIDNAAFIQNDSQTSGFEWVQGTIHSTSGEIRANTTMRIANESFFEAAAIKSVSVSAGYQILYGNYTDQSVDSFSSVSSWSESFSVLTGPYVRFAIRKSNSSNIAPTEDTGFEIAYNPIPVNGFAAGTRDMLEDACYVIKSTGGEWQLGGIDSSSGKIVPRTPNDRMVDPTFYKAAEIDAVSVTPGYQFLVASYSSPSEDDFVSVSKWAAVAASFDNIDYARFCIKHLDGSEISSIEDTGFEILFKPLSIGTATNERIDSLESQMSEKRDYTPASKNQIARLGWNVYSLETPPEQSIDSYRLAYRNGCAIMLCDVRVTSDGYFVLWHDETLNYRVKHLDGSSLTAEELQITIAGSTLAELNAFDFGIYKGSEYAGSKIPMLESLLDWCGLMNCWPMLEIKVQLTEAQCVSIADMCKEYGLGERTIIDEYRSNLRNTVNYWIQNMPKATVCIIAGNSMSDALELAATLKAAGLKTLITLSTLTQLAVIQDAGGNLDHSKVQAITSTGTDLTYTEIQSESALEDFYDAGYLSVFRYISSSYVNINKWIKNTIG